MRTLKVVPTNGAVNLYGGGILVARGAPPLIDNGDMAEIAKRWNAHPALVAALEQQANNYHYRDTQSLCWCRGEDRQPWPGCQDQPQCVAARKALGVEEEDK